MMLGSVTSLSYFGVATIEVGVAGRAGGPFGNQGMWCDCEHWLKCQLPSKGKVHGAFITFHILLCERGLFPGNPGIKLPFFFLFFFLFLEGCPTVPIVLIHLYLKYDILRQLKPSALLPCYFQNVSKCRKLSTRHDGLGKAGIGVFLGSLLV